VPATFPRQLECLPMVLLTSTAVTQLLNLAHRREGNALVNLTNCTYGIVKVTRFDVQVMSQDTEAMQEQRSLPAYGMELCTMSGNLKRGFAFGYCPRNHELGGADRRLQLML